ncbi:hypothetical protein [Selenomonas sp. AE3005]|uniref:hypothetical protein n=1 Tax=Selenomonas sp. AE3005 TaxID=1485543 RepID=UPI0012DCC85E|nr:hypothetical protein [Selenomonas sp. AE3005]
MTGKERKRNLQLTRYIVCALILGNGLLFAPTAEAVDIEVTGAPTGVPGTISADTTNHRAYPQYTIDTWTLNYDSSGNAWANYTAYGAYKGQGGGQFTLQNGTILNAYGKYQTGGGVGGQASDGKVIISGGEVTGFVYGGYSENSSATENIVTIEGSPELSSAVIVGGRAASVASDNKININAGVTVKGIKGGDGGTTGTRNTLNLGATGIKVGIEGIRGTQTIGITSGVGFDTSKTVLEMTGNLHNVSDIQDVTYLDLTDATGLTNTGKTGEATTVGTMTLVKDQYASIGISKWKYGANEGVLTGSTAFATNTGQEYTPSGGNGAKLIYTNTHTVKFTDSNQHQIDYTIANSVTGVNLANWDSTKAAFAVPTGWTKGTSAVTVSGTISDAAKTAVGAGNSKDILTADAGVFAGANIASTIAYGDKGDFSDAIGTTGVTLVGDNMSGVKVEADGTKANAKLTYYGETKEVKTVNLGNMTWGTTASPTGYKFIGGSSGTGINASGLTFGTVNTALATDASMTLLSNATGLTTANVVTGGTGKTVAIDYTDDDKGINYEATATGNVTAAANALNYTVSGVTLNNIDLSNWTGVASTLPNSGWTGSNVAVVTGNFSVTPTTNFDIFTTTTENFFGSVTGTHVYTAAGEAFSNEDKGVTISGNKAGGVKVTNNGTIANAKLTYYAEAFDGQNITLGSMAWGTPRDAGSAYSFGNQTAINAANLSFTNPMAVGTVGTSTALLTNADGLPADSANITGASHTQNFTNAAADNGVKFNGTINGTVSTTLGQVNYTVSGKSITGIDLAGWDSTKAAYSLTGWTKGLTAGSINAAGFTAPTTLTAGSSQDIITTSTPSYFSDAYITGAQKYGASTTPSSDTDKGVTFTVTQDKGVKPSDNGQNLVYAVGKMAVSNIALGNMTVGAGGLVNQRTVDANYTFDGSPTINATNLTFDKPAEVENSTLVSNATGITSSNSVTGADHSQAISDAAIGGGIKVSGTLTGTVSADTGEVKYTVNKKTISSMDLSGWDATTEGTLPNNNWTGNNVAVSTGTFTAPTADKTVFTTDIANFFGDVTGAMAYTPGAAFSGDEVNGVTLSGTRSGGVKKSNDGSDLEYIAEVRTVNNIALGNMTFGTPRTATSNYTFNGSTSIDATNLTFDKPADVADSTLFANATGITTGNPVTGASHSQAITNAAMGGGITASGTLHGTVAADTNAVKYTVTDKTVSSMDLSGWDTTTTVNGLPNNWTGSNVAVSTGTFTAPTTDKTIFTTDITNFFGDVTGAMAYTSGAAYSGDEGNGVTLSGTKSGGVKKSDDGKNLNFIAEVRTVNNITLGNMTWGTGRAMPATGYTFSVAANGVDATNLKFSFTGTDANTIANGNDWNLLTNANGLAADLVVKGTPVSQNISYSLANGATLGGTLTGKVKTYANTVNYAVTGKTLDSVDISGWDGSTTGAVNDTWSKAASGIAVTGSGFTAPTTVGDYNILTATPTGYFTGAQIADSIAYIASGEYSETDSDITLSGTQSKGVKVNDNGTALQYSLGNVKVNTIKIGNVNYNKGGTVLDRSDLLYDYSGVNSNGLDISGLGMIMSDDQKKVAAASDSMTLVKANTTLSDIAAKETGKSTYTYDATSGLAVKGALTGAVAATNNNVVYTVTGNNATTLTFGTVGWNSTYARTDSEIAYTGALVNADNITFTSDTALNVGDTMVLVSNYGGAVNKIRSGIFTLNGQTGKGHAYYDNGSLYYKITRAAGTEVPTVNAIGITETVDDNPGHQGDVIGGQAKGDGESTNNEVDVKNSEIEKKDDGTGGDVKGGTSEDGPSQENKADVKDSKVEGDVIGGESDSGPSRRNQAIVRGSTIGGDVSGGDTNGGGDTEENKTEVKDSKVGGDVNGGHSGGNGNSNKNDVDVDHTTVDGDVNGGNSDGDGNADGNNADVKNGSKVGGDVNGGHSGGNGHTNGNNANVDGSTVDGDVNGGKSDGNGDANENKTDVKNGSKVGGSVTGGQSNGGNTNKNETTVSGSTVNKDVIGGKTNGDGTSNENKTNVDGSNVGGSVIGGQSQNGDASENKTDVKNGSTVGGNVTGGQSNGGNTNKNETTVSGGSTVNGDVTGGKTSGNGTSSENKTNVDGSNVGGSVIGGQSENGDANKNETSVTGGSTVTGDVLGGKTTGTGNANENKTNVDGSNVSGNVIGGYSKSGDASANETSVSGGSVGGSVYGGQSDGNGNANTNKVNLAGGVNVNGKVYGGYSATGDASGNGIDIGNGKVNGDIYGGFSGGSGSTINNTITLHGGADVSNSNIIGGNNGTAGNTLNIGNSNEPWTGGSQSVKNISGIETLNYTNFAWNSGTPALTISDGTSSDLSGTTIAAKQVAFTGIKTLNTGSTMTLLDQSNVAADKRATNVNAGSEFTVGTATEGTGKLVLDANGNVVYQVESAGASRQTHNTVMAAEAAAVALNAGNDFILSAREGLARKENIGKDGVAVFAKIGGGAMRQETGSHVNVNMWNGIVAVGRKNVQKESTTEYGVFIEHGWGNFSTHSDNAQRGDGSVDYTGGGLLGKWMKADGLYVEGSLRIGSMHEKANNLLRDTVRGYGYDERTTYKGFHLGVGKEFAINDGNTVEVYGKYFYNRKDGMNFNAGLDEYNLDAVTSQILRVGARYTMKRERWNYYGDLSYEHELDGQAAGRANGMAIRGADTSGGSVRLELGAKLLANEKSPWTLDLNLTGYAGKKQGLQGGVSVKFMF